MSSDMGSNNFGKTGELSLRQENKQHNHRTRTAQSVCKGKFSAASLTSLAWLFLHTNQHIDHYL